MIRYDLHNELPCNANGKYDIGLDCGQRVRVHFNLQRGEWVIAARVPGIQGWRTVHNCDTVILDNCRAVVSDAGVKRVCAQQVRSVCARIEGTLVAIDTDLPDSALPRRISFNPYRASTFTTDDGAPWEQGDTVYFAKKRATDVAPRGARCYESDED